jgi:hypothetical protein
MSTNQTLTVGELREALEGLPNDHLLSFSGDLTFYRLKRWNENEHIGEFNEAQGDLSPGFKKRNPQVKVVFMGTEGVAWDADGIIGSQDVEVR